VATTALIAEPSQAFREPLEAIIEEAGLLVIARSSLEDARKDISEHAPGFVLTSLKLGSFNGVHLVYLAKLANPLAVCVVYGEPDRAEEAQRAGAIYVERQRIRESLPHIIESMQRRALERTAGVVPFPGSRLTPALDHDNT
jgi:DNA-binding NtrC family response regulator